MSKESFQYPETVPIFKTLEEISQRSSVSRGRAFEDVIRASVAALAAETMETEYFEAIKEHTQGKVGKRGVDLFGKFFGQTVEAISLHDNDVLGDMFQSAISYGENAFYMTPRPVSTAISKMMSGDPKASSDGNGTRILDPCCGTGILLIEAGKEQERAELCGVDIDSRCADICAINLGLRSRYGWVICGNSLSRKVQYAYRIGSFYHEGPNGLRRGVIRKVSNDQCPVLPELQRETKRDLLNRLDEDKQPTSNNGMPLPIVEIPDWLLRLEAQTASVPKGTAKPTVESTENPIDTESDNRRNENLPPPRQQRLF